MYPASDSISASHTPKGGSLHYVCVAILSKVLLLDHTKQRHCNTTVAPSLSLTLDTRLIGNTSVKNK